MDKIESTTSTSEFYGQEKRFRDFANNLTNSRLDTKVQDIVLRQAVLPVGTLFATASLPCIMDLIPNIAIFPQSKSLGGSCVKREGAGGRVNLYPLARGRLAPIGLLPCELFLPFNVIMQFVLFIPGFREIFSFAPKNFHFMSDFIDQYICDQEKRRRVSSANPNLLLQRLRCSLSADFFYNFKQLGFADFLFGVVQAAFGENSSCICNSIAFRPEWHVRWNQMFPFSSVIDLPSRPVELFVSIQNTERLSAPLLINRQFFTQPDSYCYDLDAFIEEQGGCYVGYLKTADGIWYRCLDSNVMAVRSTLLNVPLSRSVFLHYTRIWPL